MFSPSRGSPKYQVARLPSLESDRSPEAKEDADAENQQKTLLGQINSEAKEKFPDPADEKKRLEWSIEQYTERSFKLKGGDQLERDLKDLNSELPKLNQKLRDSLKKLEGEKESKGADKNKDRNKDPEKEARAQGLQTLSDGLRSIYDRLNPNATKKNVPDESPKLQGQRKEESKPSETKPLGSKPAEVIHTSRTTLSIKNNSSYFAMNTEVKIGKEGLVQVSGIGKDGKTVDLTKNCTLLYLGKDRILRDQSGKVISEVQTATGGKIESSFVSTMFSGGHKPGEIMTVRSDLLNHFLIGGKQIIFLSGNPTKDEKSGQSSIESKAKSSKELETPTAIPSIKHKYHELNSNGLIERTAHLRFNKSNGQNKLEISIGMDQAGKEVWVDAERVSHPKFTVLAVDKSAGKIFDRNGNSVNSFIGHNGRFESASTAIRSLDFKTKDKSGIISYPGTELNDIKLNGRFPIFIEK